LIVFLNQPSLEFLFSAQQYNRIVRRYYFTCFCNWNKKSTRI